MTSQEIYTEMEALMETFKAEHAKNQAGNKSAGARARKAIGEVKKMVTSYRAASTSEGKN